MIDWRDRTRVDEIHVRMVDPHNLDIDRGELEHLILSDCSISYGYETDTRVSAKLVTEGCNYIPGSWLRIIHKSGDYQKELGTFVVIDDPSWDYKGGLKIYSYELQSVLWTLQKDLVLGHLSIGAGAYALDVIKRICNTCGRAYVFNNPNNYRYSAAKVYEACDSYLTDTFDICSTSTNRLDVDGHGRITVSKYYAPSQIEPAWDIVDADPRTLLLSSSISGSSNAHEVPSRAIVVYTNGDSEIIAAADRTSDSPLSAAQRGYTIAEKYQVSDLSPATQAGAQALAQDNLSRNVVTTQLDASFLYFPCVPGETMYLTLGGVKKKYLIKTIDPVSLKNPMTIKTTLKEVT